MAEGKFRRLTNSRPWVLDRCYCGASKRSLAVAAQLGFARLCYVTGSCRGAALLDRSLPVTARERSCPGLD